MADLREVPSAFKAKWMRWRFWQEGFGVLHLFLGSVSVALSTVVAANTAKAFLDPGVAVFMATGAAVAAFALTFVNAKQKNEAFEEAARELEAAMALYRVGRGELESLGEAEERGIRILSRNRPK